MGTIKRFDLEKLIKKYDLSYFVETGTYLGESLDFSLKFNFKKILSIEIMENLFEKAKEKYKGNDRVSLFMGDTSKQFSGLLKTIPTEVNCLFWLDAHLPIYYGMSNDKLQSKDTNIPLQKELEDIKEIIGLKNHVFIIDDLRIYEDGPFQSGNWNERSMLGGDSIKFIQDIFEGTHIIEKNYSDEGYVLVFPKKV